MTRRGLLLALGAVAVSPLAAPAATKVTLRGKLFATEGEAEQGIFFLDPEGSSESISLSANYGGYLGDYLKGCVGHTIDITIEPKS